MFNLIAAVAILVDGSMQDVGAMVNHKVFENKAACVEYMDTQPMQDFRTKYETMLSAKFNTKVTVSLSCVEKDEGNSI